MKGLFTLAGILAGLVCAAQGSLPLYRDIDVTSVNADTRRTEVIMYPSEKEALALPFEKSPFYLDLNGTWDFLYFDSEKDLIAFVKEHFHLSYDSFEDLESNNFRFAC